MGEMNLSDPMSEPTNRYLKKRTDEVEDLGRRESARWPQERQERFSPALPLGLEIPPIRLDREHRARLGTDLQDRNGFGLWRKVALNTSYLTDVKWASGCSKATTGRKHGNGSRNCVYGKE